MPELIKSLDIATDDELWGELRDRHPGVAGEEVLRIQFAKVLGKVVRVLEDW